VVPLLSTSKADSGLASEFRRDRAIYTAYERMRKLKGKVRLINTTTMRGHRSSDFVLPCLIDCLQLPTIRRTLSYQLVVLLSLTMRGSLVPAFRHHRRARSGCGAFGDTVRSDSRLRGLGTRQPTTQQTQHKRQRANKRTNERSGAKPSDDETTNDDGRPSRANDERDRARGQERERHKDEQRARHRATRVILASAVRLPVCIICRTISSCTCISISISNAD
jgi:hypothetical protein